MLTETATPKLLPGREKWKIKISCWERGGTGVLLGIKREVREHLQAFSRGEELLESLHNLPGAAGNVLEHPTLPLDLSRAGRCSNKTKNWIRRECEGKFLQSRDMRAETS